MSDIDELARRMRETAEKATQGEWHHCQPFERLPKQRTIHGPIPAQNVDYVSTWPGKGTPNGHSVIIHMEGREAAVRSRDMAHIAASCPANVLTILDDRDRLAAELRDISAAIGCTRWMDPPDGGDVTLAEQVRRMRDDRARMAAEVARLRDALRFLVALKDYKDAHGGDAYYQEVRPRAWERALAALTTPTSAAPERDERAIRAAALREARHEALKLRFGPPSGWGGDRPPNGWWLDTPCAPAQASAHDVAINRVAMALTARAAEIEADEP